MLIINNVFLVLQPWIKTNKLCFINNYNLSTEPLMVKSNSQRTKLSQVGWHDSNILFKAHNKRIKTLVGVSSLFHECSSFSSYLGTKSIPAALNKNSEHKRHWSVNNKFIHLNINTLVFPWEINNGKLLDHDFPV